jgi:hypothetical protein
VRTCLAGSSRRGWRRLLRRSSQLLANSSGENSSAHGHWKTIIIILLLFFCARGFLLWFFFLQKQFRNWNTFNSGFLRVLISSEMQEGNVRSKKYNLLRSFPWYGVRHNLNLDSSLCSGSISLAFIYHRGLQFMHESARLLIYTAKDAFPVGQAFLAMMLSTLSGQTIIKTCSFTQ